MIELKSWMNYLARDKDGQLNGYSNREIYKNPEFGAWLSIKHLPNDLMCDPIWEGDDLFAVEVHWNNKYPTRIIRSDDGVLLREITKVEWAGSQKDGASKTLKPLFTHENAGGSVQRASRSNRRSDKMKYEVGDTVKIREDLVVNESYGCNVVTRGMTNHLGMVCEIKEVVAGGYKLSLKSSMNWTWTDQMLDPVFDERGLPIFETDKPEEIKPLSIHTTEGGFPAFKTDPPDNGLPHTPHYMNGLIETIDVIKMALTPEEFRGFLKGNVLKYQIRAPHKNETPDEDYQKAKDYYDLLEGLQ